MKSGAEPAAGISPSAFPRGSRSSFDSAPSGLQNPPAGQEWVGPLRGQEG